MAEWMVTVEVDPRAPRQDLFERLADALEKRGGALSFSRHGCFGATFAIEAHGAKEAIDKGLDNWHKSVLRVKAPWWPIVRFEVATADLVDERS